jgi:hypothetical protein
MSEPFLTEDDFPNHTVFSKAEVGLMMSLFDFMSRGARCRGLVSYIFDQGGKIQAIEELIGQFGEIDRAEAFMDDERQRLSRVGEFVSLDVVVDDAICVITHEYIPAEGKDNLLHVWCTVRDQLFVVRLMIFVRTVGEDLELLVIKDCIEKALKRIQYLKVAV